jgi:hypothetical protein
VSTGDVKKAYALATEFREIRTWFGFFINPPNESVRGFLETLWFFLKGSIVLKIRNGGSVCLNWIRIEPDTEIYDTALREKVITEETELLPESAETRPAELYYSYPPLKKFDWIAKLLLRSYEVPRAVYRRIKG